MADQSGNGASLADFIWKNAGYLWGDLKHTDFGNVMQKVISMDSENHPEWIAKS
jgi:hypothetical protein